MSLSNRKSELSGSKSETRPRLHEEHRDFWNFGASHFDDMLEIIFADAYDLGSRLFDKIKIPFVHNQLIMAIIIHILLSA